ncbi:MAG TPA: thiamine pyrophosphate-dependent enzyme [Acidimicrobiia bacterium]|nr:thiamine pyrophosphate-dependent enzyme [Acidimicrobiia bacterium]
MRWAVPEAEYMDPGTLGCQGCGGALSMRQVLKQVGDNAIAVLPACCWSIIDGPWPLHAVNIPVLHTAFETAAVVATGVKAAKQMQGKDTTVVAWAGDGGTFDIGLQALSGAAERNEDILFICYDNEAYMNTGIQRSSATPAGTWTTTTPEQRPEARPKKDIMAIVAAHRIPYAATATVAYPEDLARKVRTAVDMQGGMRFLHLLAACPPGWKMPADQAIEAMRRAVQAKVFPLYEVRDGATTTITVWPDREIPLEHYLELQGRFTPLLGDAKLLDVVRQDVGRRWRTLVARHEASLAPVEPPLVVPAAAAEL